MSSLFTQKSKPHQHATIQNLTCNSLTKRKQSIIAPKIKSDKPKSDIDFLSSDDDDEKVDKYDGSAYNNEKDDDEDDCIEVKKSKTSSTSNNSTTNTMKTIKENETKNNIVNINHVDDDDDNNFEDELTKSAKLLLQKVGNTKNKMTISNTTSYIVPSLTNNNTNKSIDHFVMPKVLSASERAKEKEKLISLDKINKSISMNQISIKVETKLNGMHDWKWLVPIDDSFEKFRTKFAEVYLLSSNSFKILFDGLLIQDKHTCRSLGITDNDIIDIQVDSSLYHKAVESAKSFKNMNANIQTTSSNSNSILNHNTTSSSDNNMNTSSILQPSIASATIVVNGIHLITRLNGSHIRKWNISKSEPFVKFRKTFAETYNLSIDKVKFVFDGEKIQDKDTPSSLDMEDNNMIDVKIDLNLVATAVAYASSKDANHIPIISSSSSNTSTVTPAIIVNGIHLTTRLNGTHVLKWHISKNEPFSKFRKTFAETYNLSIDKVKFVFDGEKIQDKDTPSSLDMEDNNMIDVKIEKELYNNAVTAANINKK